MVALLQPMIEQWFFVPVVKQPSQRKCSAMASIYNKKRFARGQLVRTYERGQYYLHLGMEELLWQ